MTATEVRSIIRRGFSHLGLANWKYLECSRNNFLTLAECQEVDGAAAVGQKGCLYICEEVNIRNLQFNIIITDIFCNSAHKTI